MLFHHLTAKLLYLAKRTRPDLQAAVSFLTMRVLVPDVDDWKNWDVVSVTFMPQPGTHVFCREIDRERSPMVGG